MATDSRNAPLETRNAKREARVETRLHRLRLAPGEPLFAALATALPGLSRQQARRAVTGGLCRIDGVPAMMPQQVVETAVTAELDLRQGIRIAWVKARHGATPVQGPAVSILHIDPFLCVIDKAAGVDSAPVEGQRGHAADLLRRTLRAQKREVPFIGQVHRLDKDTSGCLCFAMKHDAQAVLTAQFAGEAAVRTYRCLVSGQPPRDADTITGRQGRARDGRRALVDDGPGVEAVTKYRVLRRFATGAELEVLLGTGRTHQIRVAMASIGCPVFGDRVYGKGHPQARAPRLMLHAISLEVDHPRLGSRLRVEAPLPEVFTQFARALERAAPTQATQTPARTPRPRPGPRAR
jgi:23S rRNA pseudouridine1911/1915/1917 synthase